MKELKLKKKTNIHYICVQCVCVCWISQKLIINSIINTSLKIQNNIIIIVGAMFNKYAN